ncbi:hypothetical protein CB1_001413011 [Camelus ferus]|nr:hypothetical protein CB1_001413011 [Camelus ferus]
MERGTLLHLSLVTCNIQEADRKSTVWLRGGAEGHGKQLIDMEGLGVRAGTMQGTNWRSTLPELWRGEGDYPLGLHQARLEKGPVLMREVLMDVEKTPSIQSERETSSAGPTAGSALCRDCPLEGAMSFSSV